MNKEKIKKLLKIIGIILVFITFIIGNYLIFINFNNKKYVKNKQITIKQKINPCLYQKAIQFSKKFIPEKYIKIIVEKSMKTKYKEILLSIITTESHFDFFAINKSGAIGCGQIKWKFWKDKLKQIGIKKYRDMFTPEACVIATNYVFNYYFEKANSDIEKALKYYYCGESSKNCKKFKKYFNKFLYYYFQYKNCNFQ